jgi:hypothetical protein
MGMSGACMIGMSVGDQRAINRPHRINVKIAGRAVKTFGCGTQQLVKTHDLIDRSATSRWKERVK